MHVKDGGRNYFRAAQVKSLAQHVLGVHPPKVATRGTHITAARQQVACLLCDSMGSKGARDDFGAAQVVGLAQHVLGVEGVDQRIGHIPHIAGLPPRGAPPNEGEDGQGLGHAGEGVVQAVLLAHHDARLEDCGVWEGRQHCLLPRSLQNGIGISGSGFRDMLVWRRCFSSLVVRGEPCLAACMLAGHRCAGWRQRGLAGPEVPGQACPSCMRPGNRREEHVD